MRDYGRDYNNYRSAYSRNYDEGRFTAGSRSGGGYYGGSVDDRDHRGGRYGTGRLNDDYISDDDYRRRGRSRLNDDIFDADNYGMSDMGRGRGYADDDVRSNRYSRNRGTSDRRYMGSDTSYRGSDDNDYYSRGQSRSYDYDDDDRY